MKKIFCPFESYKKRKHSRQIMALSLKIFHKEFSEQDVFHKVQRSPVRTRELRFKT